MEKHVTLEQLRRIHRGEPFRPFLLRTADGREFSVSHPEALAISQTGRTIVVMTPDDAHETIDLLLVSSIHTSEGERSRG
jgi:hypothetical protein